MLVLASLSPGMALVTRRFAGVLRAERCSTIRWRSPRVLRWLHVPVLPRTFDGVLRLVSPTVSELHDRL